MGLGKRNSVTEKLHQDKGPSWTTSPAAGTVAKQTEMPVATTSASLQEQDGRRGERRGAKRSQKSLEKQPNDHGR